jgi:hypothetical protein
MLSSSAATTKSYPPPANSFASSNPIPLEAPVTNARPLTMVAGYPARAPPNANSVSAVAVDVGWWSMSN